MLPNSNQSLDPTVIGASRRAVLVAVAMIAFAGNSLLCRQALTGTTIDPASFTTIRLVSGALVLWMIVHLRNGNQPGQGNWLSAFALWVYAAGFSFAYESLTAATGALLLFGAVQVTMIGHGLFSGERLRTWQIVGVLLAVAGLVGLLLPGLSAPPLAGSSLMLLAGVAWGAYSLRGQRTGDASRVTAGNFLRAVPMALLLSMVTWNSITVDVVGVGYAIASGALASGLGYVVWYAVLPTLKATQAATVQLGVPVLAALGGILLLDEAFSWRLLVASVVIIGGIALALVRHRH